MQKKIEFVSWNGGGGGGGGGRMLVLRSLQPSTIVLSDGIYTSAWTVTKIQDRM